MCKAKENLYNELLNKGFTESEALNYVNGDAAYRANFDHLKQINRHITGWPEVKSNIELLNAPRNRDTYLINIDRQGLEHFKLNSPSGNEVIQLDYVLINPQKVLAANSSGKLALLNEHAMEQNIILNKLSIEYPDILRSNLNNFNGIYFDKNNIQNSAAKNLVTNYRKDGAKLIIDHNNLSSANGGHAAHALDTCMGGSANIFLDTFRIGYANSPMGRFNRYNVENVVPGKFHKINLMVNENGVNLSIEEFLNLHNQTLNTSLCINP